jgi:hypothetical protein
MRPGTEGASLPANLSGTAYRMGQATLKSDAYASADGESPFALSAHVSAP